MPFKIMLGLYFYLSALICSKSSVLGSNLDLVFYGRACFSGNMGTQEEEGEEDKHGQEEPQISSPQLWPGKTIAKFTNSAKMR